MQNPTLYGLSDRPLENRTIRVQNAEASASITRGTPVCFVFNGTNDGVGVVLPNTGAAIKATALFAGVASQTIAAGKQGIITISGYSVFVKVLRQTRAASTDVWATTPAYAVGEVLTIDTVNNVMNRSASIAASAFLPLMVVAQTLASAATLASTNFTTGYSRTAFTTSIRALIRSM